MKAYVINLAKDIERKEYMQNILKEQRIEDFAFIEAVYGKNLSAEEKFLRFDSDAFTRKYAKIPNDAQIGCTLSHRKCFEEFIKSGEKVCLIFEDDIYPKAPMFPVIKEIQKFLATQSSPTIVLLSGWFWYTKKISLETIALGSLYSGFLAHSYMMNARAAEVLLKQKPYFVADDWHEFRKKFGLKIYGLIPHLINQKWDGEFESGTQSLSIKYEKGYFPAKLKLKFKGGIQKILSLCGHFEEIS
ncbi:MAG: glycosyltransferase family 25 protein [Treponema sp.]|nr:glycosyltransferase family 25 protein [Treponema sp.]